MVELKIPNLYSRDPLVGGRKADINEVASHITKVTTKVT